MSDSSLCVLITPSAGSAGWRDALTARAVERGWPVADTEADPSAIPTSGLLFAHSHDAMAGFPPSARVVMIDTSATDAVDATVSATPDVIRLRSHSLVEAELAAMDGATVLNASRDLLEFPLLGSVERARSAVRRVHAPPGGSPLAMFDDIAPGGGAHWHPRWFAYPEGHSGPIDAPVIDMTGRMRPVVYGPYIRLPAGRWRVDMRFTIDPERGSSPLLFEWGADTEFCRITTEIGHPGSYTVSLDRIWPEPGAAELRIWSARPAFQGQFGFQGCQVTRVDINDPTPPTPLDRIVDAAVR